MADTRPKRRRSDEQIKKKKESDKERAKFRIYIGKVFERWREPRRQKGFQSDIQVALFLLDRYPSMEGVDWSPFMLEHQQYVTLNTGLSQTLRMFRAQQCKFWDRFLPKLQYVTVSIDEVEFQRKSQFHHWLSYMLDWKNQFNDNTSKINSVKTFNV